MKLIKEMDYATENKLKKSVFVGRLATEDELVNTMIDAPVSYQDDDNEFILFNVKCLSDIPEDLSKHFLYHNKIFRGSTRTFTNIQKIKSQLIPNYDRLLPSDRKQKLWEALSDKLILFTFSQKNLYLHLDIIKLEKVASFEEYYNIIPSPNTPTSETRAGLEAKMISGSPITLLQYPNLFDDPEFLYYDEYLYSNISFKKAEIPTTYYVSNPDEVRRMKVSLTFYDKAITRLDSSILIVSQESTLSLRDEIEDEGENLWEAFHREKGQAPTKPVEPKKPDGGDDLMVIGPDDGGTSVTAQDKGTGYYEDEIRFLEMLEQNAESRGLTYDANDLYNFHTSVKANLLTIIGGMSGTGKSQLARLYGESLGLTFGQNLIMVPVSPAYHEPNDVLGYLNPTTGVYHESETGLVSLLLEANKHPESLYMVIFDEMNLAQVEHWFSPFISLLEVESSKRQLGLYNSRSYCVNERYPSKVPLGENIIFVGTVNFDETTKNFSDRLLDRTNLITPRKLTFKEVRERQISHDIYQTVQAFQIDTTTFRSQWTTKKYGELEYLTDDETMILDQLHDLLQAVDSQRGVSFRAARGIARYIANIPLTQSDKAIIPRGHAFDIQLRQRVLTKVSGAAAVIGELVGEFNGESYQEGKLVQLLQSPEAQKISNFKISIDTVKQKAKELVMNGYAN